MANTSICNDVSEAVELSESHNLFLKPIAKINVCVQLPQLKVPGKSISNWEVMEKVKSMIKPEVFVTLKIVKSTLEFIRLEGEIENKSRLKLLVAKLDGKTIKLSGFSDALKIRAAETKLVFPARHDWDSYFRDAKNTNEMRHGERPDTLHFKDLPTRWFASAKSKDRPCEQTLKDVFESFGGVRNVDIPMNDPYRNELAAAKTGAIQTFSFGQGLTFEAYVQFSEYIGFMKAMDALRGMKLLYKGEDGKNLTANVQVDFDKTQHMSEKAIRRRQLDRQKLEQLEQEKLEKAKREREEEERRQEEDRRRKLEEEREKERRKREKVQRREQRRKEREERRRLRKLEKKKREEEQRRQQKLAQEKRRQLMAQRKLEATRLMTELLFRVEEAKMKEDLERRERELVEERRRQLEEKRRRKREEERQEEEAKRRKVENMKKQEHELRDRILRKFQARKEKQAEENREELRKKLSGKVRLKSAVVSRR